MRGKKFIEVLLLIGAVALLLGGIISLTAIPTEEAAIVNAKLLRDGAYNLNNAGEKVIIILDDERLKPAFDRQMGLAFETSVVRRDVERFERRRDGGYHWKRVSSNAVDSLRYKTIYGQTYKGSRISLDPAFEDKIKTDENLGVENLTKISLKKFKNGNLKKKCHVIKKDGVSYFTNAKNVAFMDLDKANPVKLDAQVGSFRVKYTKMNLDKKSAAIIGVQKGRLIKVDPEIGKPIVIDGNLDEMFNKQNIIDRMKKNKIMMFVIYLIGAVVLAISGLKFGKTFRFKSEKNSFEDDGEEKRDLIYGRDNIRKSNGTDERVTDNKFSTMNVREQKNYDFIGNKKNKKK